MVSECQANGLTWDWRRWRESSQCRKRQHRHCIRVGESTRENHPGQQWTAMVYGESAQKGWCQLNGYKSKIYLFAWASRTPKELIH